MDACYQLKNLFISIFKGTNLILFSYVLDVKVCSNFNYRNDIIPRIISKGKHATLFLSLSLV